MMIRKIPFLTLGLTVLLAAIHWLAPGETVLFYAQAEIQSGEYWRLITGHLVHADSQHLAWNCMGLLVLGALIERSSRLDWWATLLAGIISVNLLLLSPLSHLDYYIGLSGVLNTMLLVVLWKSWLDARSWWVVLICLASLAKVIIEVSTGGSIFTNIPWPPYAWAHVAGLLGGVTLVCLRELAGSKVQSGLIGTR